MCTYVTATTTVSGSGLMGDEWEALSDAVVYFNHPKTPLSTMPCV